MTEQGIDKVIDFIKNEAKKNDASTSLTLTSARHYDALLSARESLNNCLEDMPPDILSIDLTYAWQQLGIITGQMVTEDIVNNIFEKFCVGK